LCREQVTFDDDDDDICLVLDQHYVLDVYKSVRFTETTVVHE